MRTAALLALLLAGPVVAADLPAGGSPLAAGAALRSGLPAERGRSGDLAGGGRWIEVAAPEEERPYFAQFSLTCDDALRAGERVLALVRARVADREQGRLTVKLQARTAPWTAIGSTTEFDVFRGWADYPFLFQVGSDVATGVAQFVCFCGQRTQRVEVASVQLLRYPADVALAAFPRIPRTYAGREADAPWRRAALDRIERTRKADLAAAIRDAAGRPVADADVTLVLRRHAFGFGSAVPIRWLLDETEDGRRFREIVDRYFSAVVFENDLKDFDWGPGRTPEQRAQRNARLDRALGWLAERHIAVRGHYLVQVARPPNLSSVRDADTIRAHFLESTRERLATVGGRVIEWDVINHPIAWSGADMLSRVPGLETLDRDVLRLARAKTALPLLVNEDQLFRPGRQSDETYAYLAALRRDGLPVDGLGNQAHLHESFLPSMEDIWRMTDRFAEVAPRQVITEFDIVTSGDEALAADYTRDLVIACFSHPAYSGFLWWGFWEKSHWKPEAASWNADWTPRARAAVFDQWIGGAWRTQVTVHTDRNGVARWRGFPGWYDAKSGGASLPMVEAPVRGAAAGRAPGSP